MMREAFDVSSETLALAAEIVPRAGTYPGSQTREDVDIISASHIVHPVAFTAPLLAAVRTKDTDMGAYLAALGRDIALGARLCRKPGRKVRSMYLGGGTPTVLTAEELKRLLSRMPFPPMAVSAGS